MRILFPVVALAILSLSFCGCRERESAYGPLLERAERCMEQHPDSSRALLESVEDPVGTLDEAEFARWCILMCKLSQEGNRPLPLSFYIEKNEKWYARLNQTDSEAWMGYYLGVAYTMEHETEKAIGKLTEAEAKAEAEGLDLLSGHIRTLLGSIYEKKGLFAEAIRRNREAAESFRKAGEGKLRACALRDAGREYALQDSTEQAIRLLQQAGEEIQGKGERETEASIRRCQGHVYMQRGDAEKAGECFREALRLSDTPDNRTVLAEFLLREGDVREAYRTLGTDTAGREETGCETAYLYYRIYKAMGETKAALGSLERFVGQYDSIVTAETGQRLADIGPNRNRLKAERKEKTLEITQPMSLFHTAYTMMLIEFNRQMAEHEKKDAEARRQQQVLFAACCVLLVLVLAVSYLLFRRRTRETLYRQQAELERNRAEISRLSVELGRKREALKQATDRNEEEYRQIQESIVRLSDRYRQLQQKVLGESDICKELSALARRTSPHRKTPVNERQWEAVVREATSVYPAFFSYVYGLCPTLSESDWQYCCLSLFGFNGNEEAVLLDIAPGSVHTKRLRLRQKLNIAPADGKMTLREYFVKNME